MSEKFFHLSSVLGGNRGGEILNPFRTQKSSPTIADGTATQECGRVGRRQVFISALAKARAFFFCYQRKFLLNA